MPLTKEEINVIVPHVDRARSHDELLEDLVFENSGYDYGAVMLYNKANDERLNAYFANIMK